MKLGATGGQKEGTNYPPVITRLTLCVCVCACMHEEDIRKGQERVTAREHVSLFSRFLMTVMRSCTELSL